MRPYKYFTLLLLVLVSNLGFLYSQNDPVKRLSKLNQLIQSKEIEAAKVELNNQIEYFKKSKQYDSLPRYIEYIGRKVLADDNWNSAVKNSESFVNELLKYNSPKISLFAYKNLAWIYSDAGQSDLAYQASKKALEFAKKLDENREKEKAAVQYNLGYYSSSMGNFKTSKDHYLKSLDFVKNSDKKDYEFQQQIYNSLGGVMWNQAKMDSCLHYFEEALKVLKKTDSIPINLYYRPALLSMNLAIVANNLGENNKAIDYSKEAIDNFQKFLDTGKDEQKKNGAKRSRLAAIDNLGVFYNSVGEFTKAEELITFSYNIKKEEYSDDDPNIIISKVILAQAKINTQDLLGAERLLKSAIESCKDNPERVMYWYMAANNTLAKVLGNQNKFDEALPYTKTGEELMRSYYKGNYNKDLLNELSSMAVTYAQNKYNDKAIELAKEVYNQIKSGDFKNTIQDLITTTAIAQINYMLKNYEEAIAYSNEVINFNNNRDANTKTTDSILQDISKPLALLINAKSEFALLDKLQKSDLSKILLKVEYGIDLLEQRKKIITNHDDLSLLISQNNELFDFAKKLRYELYSLTSDETYLDNVINLHESSIYNRIRSRLSLKNNMAYANIPQKIILRERTLKKQMSSSLNSDNLDSFFYAQKKWIFFKDSIKEAFPKYFKMRYEIIEEPLDNLQNNIPDETTIVRYLFIDKDLYAFVVSRTEKNIFKINTENLEENIEILANDQYDVSKVSNVYFKLYNQLWKPFASKVSTEKIIIIPDGALFNLSFETLTPNELTNFREFSSNSLLNSHTISYNYSLLLLDKSQKIVEYQKDFIAFAPEFNDKMKEDYSIKIEDSLTMDKTYLKLLPQPFTASLAKQYSNIFKGSSFLNEKASKQVFINEAKEHKIIHIGTHAESNNVTPELSRLIFAKDVSGEDNSLYTYEIYNHNLSSNLAILTACETGKPTFQSGEGMISLAHAFNYAGSESILTSLWKIDEKSSAEILKYFYNNLSDGLSKDEALKQAKLSYIEEAEGRTMAPQYWAGLVLIGNNSPVEISSTNNLWLWIILGLLALGIIMFFIRKQVAKTNL